MDLTKSDSKGDAESEHEQSSIETDIEAPWVKKVSKSQGGKPYYFNPISGESRWTRPMTVSTTPK